MIINYSSQKSDLNKVFSNFYHHPRLPLQLDGKKYPTAEHAFQAGKSLNQDYQNSFINPKMTALEAKRNGGKNGIMKTLNISLRNDWDEFRIIWMKYVLFYKFNDPLLKLILLHTDDADLIHTGFRIDKFWGANKNGGENYHGKILMELRSHFQKGTKPQFDLTPITIPIPTTTPTSIINHTPTIISTKKETTYIYTDGACSNNGKSDAKAGIGIYFGELNYPDISKIVDGTQTNNAAELTAIIKACKICIKRFPDKHITICSDSGIAIGWCTTTGEKYNKANWETSACKKLSTYNLSLIKKGFNFFKKHKNIVLLKVKGHSDKNDIHAIGNDKADKLAKQAITMN